MKKIIFIPILIWLQCEIRSQTYCVLVLTNNNHAYVDENGKLLYSENIDPLINEKIFAYKNGMGRIRRSGKFGFINHKGEIVIPIIYDKAEDFNEGLAEVEINGKCGYINLKGEFVIKPTLNFMHRFSCGLAVVSEKGKHGYMDKTGNVVITPIYDRVCHFRDNKAWVLLNGKWGCINKKGVFIINPVYVDTRDFSEGYAWVKEGMLWGLIDSLNKFIITPNERNNLMYAFSGTLKNYANVTNGLIISKANNKVGFCSLPSLKKVIASKFDGALEFEDSVAIAWVDGKQGIIDMKGNFIVEPIYREINRIGQKTIFAAKTKDKMYGLLDITSGKFSVLNFKNILYLEKIEKL